MAAHPRLLMLGASFALVLAVPGHAAELNPAALVYQLPDQIKWNAPSAAGSQNAVLVGDPSKPGLYLVRNKWLKGNHFSRPHFHPYDRFITVLGGTWWMGSGTNFDPNNSVPLPAGTFVTHFGREVHWDGAKDEDASLFIFGDGPGTSTPVEPTAGKFSALDPKAVVYTHFHPNDRFITVVKGTWWVATGNKVDKDNMMPMTAGSFVTHFGKQVHWDGAKDEEAWLVTVGEGPGTLTLVDATN